MTTYRIDWTDGTTSGGIATEQEARTAIWHLYPHAEIGHDGDLSEGGDRTLCWESEEDAGNDDGARAFATIRREESGL